MYDYTGKKLDAAIKYAGEYPARPLKTLLKHLFFDVKSLFRMAFSSLSYSVQSCSRRGPLKLAFVLDGGIGDVVMNALYVLELSKRVDAEHEVFVVANLPHKALCELFCGVFTEAQLIPKREFKPGKYDLVISINVQYPVVSEADSRRLRASAFLTSYVEILREFRRKRGASIASPLDSFRQQYDLIARGKTRITALDVGEVLGFQHDSTYRLHAPEYAKDIINKYGLAGKPFITVARSLDMNNEHISGTRLWAAERYDELIALIKREWPDVMIVQLGGSKEKCVPLAVDLDLVGQTSLGELLALLEASVLHIDGECGMVHVRHFLGGGPSLVLFGPTSPKTKGYSENINVRSTVCPFELCEWFVGKNWQTHCLRNGTADADCMKDLSVREVFEHVSKTVLFKRNLCEYRPRIIRP